MEENSTAEGRKRDKKKNSSARDDYRQMRRENQQNGAEASFESLLAGLHTQTLMALGEFAHPVTGEKSQDLQEAQYLIDTLGVLQEKTQGNLTEGEEKYMRATLQNLRMQYVRIAEEANEAGEGGTGEDQ